MPLSNVGISSIFVLLMASIVTYYSTDFIKNMFRQEREVDSILLLLIGVLSFIFMILFKYCPITYSYKQNLLASN